MILPLALVRFLGVSLAIFMILLSFVGGDFPSEWSPPTNPIKELLASHQYTMLLFVPSLFSYQRIGPKSEFGLLVTVIIIVSGLLTSVAIDAFCFLYYGPSARDGEALFMAFFGITSILQPIAVMTARKLRMTGQNYQTSPST